MRLEVIKIDKTYVAISDKPTEVPVVFPKYVVEKLTTGNWMFWQIDNPNDWDAKTQRDILATDTSFKLEEIGQFELPAVLTGVESTNSFTREDVELIVVRTLKSILVKGQEFKLAGLVRDYERGMMDRHPKKLIAIEVDEVFRRPTEEDITSEMNTSGDINNLPLIVLPKIIKSEEYPNGMLQVKEYIYG